jgi:hypothetical protein
VIKDAATLYSPNTSSPTRDTFLKFFKAVLRFELRALYSSLEECPQPATYFNIISCSENFLVIPKIPSLVTKSPWFCGFWNKKSL